MFPFCSFNDDLEKLASIPILPALTQNAAKPFHAFDDALGDNNTSFSKQQAKSNESAVSQASSGSNSSLSSSRKPVSCDRWWAVNQLCMDALKLIRYFVFQHFTVGGDEETAATKGGVENEEKQLENVEETRAMTLLEWISRDEKQTSLRKMAEQCQLAMQKVSESEIEKMRTDAMNVIKTADQKDVKQIKGLELRLSGLEELMQEGRLTVREQAEMAQGFQQNQNRVNNLGDASILPDLCNSHEKQLNVMFSNHKKLGNIKSRIFNSKNELGNNLQQRLK